MKRSAIRLAGKTLVVSLPKQWVDLHRIRKGQELELLPLGKKLVISPAAAPQKREMGLSQKDSPWFTADALSYLYQLGMDEVRISYDSPATLRKLSSKIPQLLGFEIVEQRIGAVTVKNVASPMEEEYGAMLRRSFFVVQEMGQLLLRHAAKPYPDLLEEITSLDKTLNKLTDFCKRTINRSEMHSTLHSTVQYTLARDIERIGDEFRYAAMAVSRHGAASPAGLRAVKDANSLFSLFHDLNYGFDNSKATAFHDLRKKLVDEASVLLERSVRADAILGHYLLNAGVMLKDLFGPLYLGVLSRQNASEQSYPHPYQSYNSRA